MIGGKCTRTLVLAKSRFCSDGENAFCQKAHCLINSLTIVYRIAAGIAELIRLVILLGH